MSEWISVKERFPLEPDETVTFESLEVLVTDGYLVKIADYQRGSIGEAWAAWGSYGGISAADITHWQPLPTPPETTK